MSSTQFTFDLEDARFVLFDQLRIPETLAALPRYADLDRDVYDATVSEAYKVAREILNPLNRPGDRQGCRLDADGNVLTPDGYAAAWEKFRAGGWIGPQADEEVGGAGLPAVIEAVLSNMFTGACCAFTMYAGLTGAAARMVRKFAPQAWRVPVARKMFTGEWSGTMCLTEPGAGSSIGDSRTRATPTEEVGTYLLEGEKIFITGGDCDLTRNIVHLVLARTPEAPVGVKGLSLFVVPKFAFDENFELGARNGVYVTKIEEKMGLHGSATCAMSLGQSGPCHGWLLGEEHQGIELMFHMMNEARVGVAVQGLAIGSAAYQYARHYAAERMQGPQLSRFREPDAPAVAIQEHPDVRRMLMTQKVIVESMRAFCYRVARDFDLAERGAESEERAKLSERIDLLVPVLKSICADLGFDTAVSAIQVFGGYGYTSEFPVEQLVRDAKIQSIYEGTNGIQALDLLGRKLRRDGGRLFMDWMTDAKSQLGAAAEEGFEESAKALDKAVDGLAGAAMQLAMLGQGGKAEVAAANAVPFQQAFGWIVLGLECVDQARVAQRLAAEHTEPSKLLVGKALNLTFFVANLLPTAVALCKRVRNADATCLDDSLFG